MISLLSIYYLELFTTGPCDITLLWILGVLSFNRLSTERERMMKISLSIARTKRKKSIEVLQIQ